MWQDGFNSNTYLTKTNILNGVNFLDPLPICSIYILIEFFQSTCEYALQNTNIKFKYQNCARV